MQVIRLSQWTGPIDLRWYLGQWFLGRKVRGVARNLQATVDRLVAQKKLRLTPDAEVEFTGLEDERYVRGGGPNDGGVVRATLSYGHPVHVNKAYYDFEGVKAGCGLEDYLMQDTEIVSWPDKHFYAEVSADVFGGRWSLKKIRRDDTDVGVSIVTDENLDRLKEQTAGLADGIAVHDGVVEYEDDGEKRFNRGNLPTADISKSFPNFNKKEMLAFIDQVHALQKQVPTICYKDGCFIPEESNHQTEVVILTPVGPDNVLTAKYHYSIK